MMQSDTTSRAFWESAFLYAPEALFVADANGTLSHWNELLGQLVGQTAVQGMPLSHLFHEDDRAAFAAIWAQLREATGPLELYGRVLTAKGILVPLSCVLRRAHQDGEIYGSLRRPPTGIQGVAGEAGREDTGDTLRVLAENLPIIVWVIDREGIFTYHEGRGLETIGLKPQQLVGASVFDVFRDAAEQMREIKQAVGGATVHTRNNKYDVFWENWMVPIKDSLGNVQSVVGLSLDISEARKAEEELRMRLRQIERQQEVIGKLSTPIIQVWEGVLVLPMIGVVDSKRTSDVMQKLLDEVVRTGAHYAILDLTGVEVVDTQVANHMIKLVNAIRLLGAGGIICGIRPSVAQIMVELGLDLTTMVTRANLKAGLMFCIDQMRRLEAAAPQPAR